MAFVFGTAARVWLDGKQAACAINELTMEAELDEAEVTTLCSTIKDYIPGLAEVTFEMEGLFDTNTVSPATTLEAWMDARLGVVFPLTFAPEGGGSLGDPAYMMEGFLQEFAVENTVDEAATMEMTMRCSSALARGYILKSDSTAVTATGDSGLVVGTGVLDNGSATTDGGIAVLHVSAVSGTSPSGTFIVEHSADNITYTTLASFSAQTAVNGEFVEFSGTVNRYLRTAWTISGTSPSFNVEIGVKRN